MGKDKDKEPKRTKKADDKEAAGDSDPGTQSSKSKGKSTSERSEGQSTLDSYLKPRISSIEENLEARFKEFSEILTKHSSMLSKLASQEYIEDKFKKTVTADLFKTTIQEIKNELKEEIKTEIDKVNENVVELKDRLDKVDGIVESLQNKVSDMEVSIEALQEKNDELKKDNEQMKEQLAEREAKIQSQSNEIINLQLYTRKNSIRIYGVTDENSEESAEESATEVVKLIKDKLSLNVSTSDIDIAHRLGKFTKDSNRPIICKFVSRYTKYQVIKARRNLKGSEIVTREDLTIQNAKLLEKVSVLKESVRSAWSDEGKILALLMNGKKVVITRNTDLSRLAILSL